MDKSSGNLIIKFSGKESLNLSVLSKLCSSLIAILNKITLVTSNKKSEYSVSYNTGDGFSLVITKDSNNEDTIIDANINVFNTFIDILSIRKFVTRTGCFTVSIDSDTCSINNTLETQDFDSTSYSIYSSDNVIEDNLSKLSSIIISNKNSFQAIYKNKILDKRINYSKEDLENSTKKIDLESLTSVKEEYNSIMSLQVEQLDLLGSGSWKFKDIANTKNSFKAKIKDKEFAKNLKSGNVIIGYGLILKGNVKTTVVKDKHGKIVPSKSTYIIEKVHDVLYSNQVDATPLNLD